MSAAQGREPVCPRCECKPCACDQPAAHTECRFTPAWQPGTDSNLQRAGIGCTCEWDADGNPIGGHKPPCRMASAAQDRVIAAAKEWRRVYLAWVKDPNTLHEQRDLSDNGENLALSGLLDALNALDEAEAKASRV